MCISVSYQRKIFSFQGDISGKFCTDNTTGKQIVQIVYTVFEGMLLINLHSYCYFVSIIVDGIEEVTKSSDFIEAVINIVVLLNYCPDASSHFFFILKSCAIGRKEIKLMYNKVFKCKFILL